MNQVIEMMKRRRSVRSYEATSIAREELNEIISVGNLAPTAFNRQSWRFVVIENADLKRKLSETAIPKYMKWFKRAKGEGKAMRKKIDAQATDPVYYSAPVIVFVIGKGHRESCAMVCQNMMLAACSYEIGSCWASFGRLGMSDTEIKKVLDIKIGERAYGPILFGFPKGGFPEMPPKKDPIVTWA